MFQAEVDEGPSFPAFLLQQLAVCAVGVIWGAVSGECLAQLNGPGRVRGVLEAAGNVASALGPAFLLGRLARSRFPKFACSGRWVWLLPSALMAAAVLSSAFESRLGTDLLEILSPPSEGESLWAIVLFLYPTLGCLGYSLGVAPRGRRLPRTPPPN
jgi:hypothetical protein